MPYKHVKASYYLPFKILRSTLPPNELIFAFFLELCFSSELTIIPGIPKHYPSPLIRLEVFGGQITKGDMAKSLRVGLVLISLVPEHIG